MSKKVKIAMVGVGPMADLHANVIKEIENIEIVSCGSRNIENAKVFSERHKIPEARIIDDILLKPEADALWVVAPADVMADLARKVPNNIPVFFEKPVGLSVEETTSVNEVITAPNMVGLNRRFYEVVNYAKDQIYKSGGLRAIEIQMPENIDRVPDTHSNYTKQQWQYANSVHLVDLFRFFGGEVNQVRNSNKCSSIFDRSYNSLIDFSSGAIGQFNAQWYAPGGWRVTAFSNDICITLQPIELVTVLKKGHQPKVIKPKGPDSLFKPGFYDQAIAFGNLVRTGNYDKRAANLSDYLKSVELIEQLTSLD